jgi:hypothetical protein
LATRESQAGPRGALGRRIFFLLFGRGRSEARKGERKGKKKLSVWRFGGAPERPATPREPEGRVLRGKNPEGEASRLLDGGKPLKRRYEAREGFVGKRKSGAEWGNPFGIIQRKEALKGMKPTSVGS